MEAVATIENLQPTRIFSVKIAAKEICGSHAPKGNAPGAFTSRRCFLLGANCFWRYFTATVNWMAPSLRLIWNV
jgi:hypothetical protein